MDKKLIYVVALIIGFIITKNIFTPSHGPVADEIKQQIYIDGNKKYRLIPKVYLYSGHVL